jgi:hypothetical protein
MSIGSGGKHLEDDKKYQKAEIEMSGIPKAY